MNDDINYLTNKLGKKKFKHLCKKINIAQPVKNIEIIGIKFLSEAVETG